VLSIIANTSGAVLISYCNCKYLLTYNLFCGHSSYYFKCIKLILFTKHSNIDASAPRMQYQYLEVVLLEDFGHLLCRRKHCLYLIKLHILYNKEYQIKWAW